MKHLIREFNFCIGLQMGGPEFESLAGLRPFGFVSFYGVAPAHLPENRYDM